MSNDFTKPIINEPATPPPQSGGDVEVPTSKAGGTFSGILATIGFGVLIYTIPTIAVLFLLQAFFMGQGDNTDALETYFDSTVGQFVFMGVVSALSMAFLAMLMRYVKETWESIGLKKPQAGAVAKLLTAVLVYYASIIALGVLVENFTTINTEQEQDIGFTNVTDSQLYLVFLSLVILPPITEEIIFRGFLYTRFKKYIQVVPAAILVSILFSAAHLQLGNGEAPLWTAAIDTFVLSLILVWLREKTGSIIPGMVLHGMKNALAFVVLFIAT
jgi:hypothetical protein